MAEFYAGAVKAKIIFDDSDFNQGVESVQQKTGNLGKSADAMGQLFKKGLDLAKQGLEASVVAAEDFNKKFANVTTLVDPAVTDLGKMRTELLALDNRLGSATDLTEGLYQAISASVEPAKAVEFVGEAAKFARAGLTSTNKAVDVITTSLNAYGLEADQAGRVSDVLFETIKRGKTTGDQLARSIGKSIPLAANAGVEFEELGATIAVLTRQGNSTAESTTQVNSAISSLIKPSKGAAAALEQMGFDSAKAAIEQNGLVGTIKGMIATTDGSNESIAQLFPNIRALRGALALTGDGAKDFDEVLQGMRDSTGATEEAFQKQELTFETFENTVNKLAISLGDELLPFVYTVTEAFTGWIDQLTRSGDLADALGTGVSFLSGAFDLLTFALEPVVKDLLKTGTEEFESISEKITGSSDATKKAQAPFAIFAKALGILSDVATTLIKGFSLTAKSIINVVNTANSAGKILQELGKFLTFQESDIAGAWAELGDDFGVLTDDLVKGVGDLVGAASDTISGLFEDVTDEAEQFQKVFEDGMNKTNDALKKNQEATDNAKTSNQALNETQQEQPSYVNASALALAAYNEKLKETYGSTKELTRSQIDFENQEYKSIMAIRTQEQALEELTQAALDLGQSALGTLNDGLFEVGKALGSGGDAADAFGSAIANVALEILKALPSLLLQAGLTMLTSFPANIPVGLALIAAAGVAALGVGAIMGALGVGVEPPEPEPVKTDLEIERENLEREKILKDLRDIEAKLSTEKDDGKKEDLVLKRKELNLRLREIDQKAVGGIARGLTLVGEEGPELVNFGSPSMVTPADETSSMMQGGINIYFTGPINSEIDLQRASVQLGRELQAKRTVIR